MKNMNKLYFKYGTMNSSKSANLLMMKHNYEEQGMVVSLMKPIVGTNDNPKKIISKVGLQADCKSIKPDEDLSYSSWSSADVLIVDDAHFLTTKQVDQLYKISCSIPVVCFGLLTDSNQHLFEGSKRLIELAESLEKIKTVCKCGNGANYNVRFDTNGRYIENGEQIDKDDKYEVVCKECLEKIKRYKVRSCIEKYQ